MFLVFAHSFSLHWSRGVDNSDVNQKAKDDRNQTINNIAKDDERKKRRQDNPISIASSHVDFCALNFFKYKKTHIWLTYVWKNTLFDFFSQNVFDCYTFVFPTLVKKKSKYILMLIKRSNMMKNKWHYKGWWKRKEQGRRTCAFDGTTRSYDFTHLKETTANLQRSNVFASLLCPCLKNLHKCGCHPWSFEGS